jgi:hypothetical protein
MVNSDHATGRANLFKELLIGALGVGDVSGRRHVGEALAAVEGSGVRGARRGRPGGTLCWMAEQRASRAAVT